MRYVLVYRPPYSSLHPVSTSVFFDEFSRLSQHVSGPTHLSGQTLDLITTRSSDDIVLACPKTTFPISDHFIIQCPIGFSQPALSCKKTGFS
ncbi:unnamed protein product [Pocillopora meandrina]|uniref:Endonuclease/exonuclease/phosphatase domain-containing protein n=1 Tax=Pocillopora meandrina TaxID=46732 RepID=A0AAU9W837_9CNID|nr:unnamed protein product [Pocillopora meandrina]